MQNYIPKILNFDWPQNGKFWYILWPFGLVFKYLVYICMSWQIGIFCDNLCSILPIYRFCMLNLKKSGTPATYMYVRRVFGSGLATSRFENKLCFLLLDARM
jgi:hypothetical protein